MKLVTILCMFFLLTLNAYSYESEAEINALTFEDTMWTLLYRAYPDCKFKVRDDFVYEDENKPTFADVINVLGTPECAATLPALEAELIVYKAELVAELQYRLQLQALKAIAETKYLAVKQHYHSAAKKAGLPHVANPAAWYRDNCKRVNTHEKVQSCIDKLTLVQIKIAEVQADIDAEVQDKLDCKNYKQVLIDSTLEQALALSDVQFRTKVFKALQCIARGK